MNLADKDFGIVVFFKYSLFQIDKDYDIILYDFLNPSEKIVSNPKKSWKIYRVFEWTVRTENNYVEEGIPKNILYKQEIPENSFGIALEKYKIIDKKTWKSLRENKDKIFTVRMIFSKESKKKMHIKKLEILNEEESIPNEPVNIPLPSDYE